VELCEATHLDPSTPDQAQVLKTPLQQPGTTSVQKSIRYLPF